MCVGLDPRAHFCINKREREREREKERERESERVRIPRGPLLLEMLGPVLGVVALGFVAPRAPLHGGLS
jgi:hypothetical protein